MTHDHSRSIGNRPIGVFDSGLGGLSAVRQIRTLLPGEDLIYFGDTGRVPYGTRSRDTIRRYAAQDIRFLLSHADCKAVVVACGTVSANALEELRTDKEASFSVTSQACALFVPLVENGFVDADDPIPRLTAERYLKSIRESGADTLILGCTHYPLLAAVISAVLPNVTLIDTGYEAARSLSALLTEQKMASIADEPGISRFYVSDEPQNFAGAAARFLGLSPNEGLPTVEKINIELF